MRASNRTFPLMLAASIFVATNGAMAGPQSMLDPYAYVPAPRPAAKAARPAPARKPAAGAALPGTGVVDGVKQVGGGIVSTSKAAGGAVVSGTKTVGSGIISGGKAAGGVVVSGTKAVGSGIAAGAKKGGGVFISGAQAVGHGFAVVGGKLKDGTAAAGEKIAAAPKVLKKPARTEQKAQTGQEKSIEKAPESVAGLAPHGSSGTVPGSPGLRDAIATPAPEAAAPSKPEGGVVQKVTAVPKAIGGGIKSAAASTGKVVTAPFRSVGKFFGHGGDESPRATAQGPGATK